MISLDWTLLVQMAIFLAFVAYLNAFLLRPMSLYLERRKKTIEELRSSGGDQDSSLDTLQRDYREKIGEAHDDLLAQRTAARKEALDLQNSILDEAKKEANEELRTAEAELAREASAAREKLSAEVRSLASSVSHRILGRACQ